MTPAQRRFADELRKWWSFDNGQVHTHTWHSREDFIEKALPKLLSQTLAFRLAATNVERIKALRKFYVDQMNRPILSDDFEWVLSELERLAGMSAA